MACLLVACAPQWTSRVTLVRQGACNSRIGSYCVYDYESYTVEREGRCTEQRAAAGERVARCEERRERGSIGLLVVAVVVGVVTALGFAALDAYASFSSWGPSTI